MGVYLPALLRRGQVPISGLRFDPMTLVFRTYWLTRRKTRPHGEVAEWLNATDC